MYIFFLFFKQNTAYEMRISDWSSDVCSSDLSLHIGAPERRGDLGTGKAVAEAVLCAVIDEEYPAERPGNLRGIDIPARRHRAAAALRAPIATQHQQVRIAQQRSEEHTSELQSLLRNSYAVLCLKPTQSATLQTKPRKTHGTTTIE